jgi:hypothetical protein
MLMLPCIQVCPDMSPLEPIILTSSSIRSIGFFGGTIYNRVGVKACLMFGGFGYALLESAYFATAHIADKATAFPVVADCVEGISAAMVCICFIRSAAARNALDRAHLSELGQQIMLSKFLILHM